MKDEKIKSLIKEGHMEKYEIISRKLFLQMKIYFDNHKPVIISKRKWNDYWDILDAAEAGKY